MNNISAKLLEFYGLSINSVGVTYFLMDEKKGKFTFSTADMQTMYNETGINPNVTKLDVMVGAASSMISRKCVGMHLASIGGSNPSY